MQTGYSPYWVDLYALHSAHQWSFACVGERVSLETHAHHLQSIRLISLNLTEYVHSFVQNYRHPLLANFELLLGLPPFVGKNMRHMGTDNE